MERTKSQSLIPVAPKLGALRCELTQAAIDIALQEFNTSYTIEKYVEQQRGAFFIKVGGPVTMSNFGMTIKDGKGIPSVDFTNEFKLFCRVPLLGERQFESLPFQISAPTMRVSLHAEGSKGFATLYLDALHIDLPQAQLPPALQKGRLGDVLSLLKQSIKVVVDELKRALNEKLQREPFQIFDLSRTEIPIGANKRLMTRIILDEFAFEDDRIVASLQIYAAHPSAAIELRPNAQLPPPEEE